MIDTVDILIELVTYLKGVEVDPSSATLGVYGCRLDDERWVLVILRIKMEGNFIKYRRREGITHRSWAVWIEAKHREDGPGTHRTRVVVAWDTADIV